MPRAALDHAHGQPWEPAGLRAKLPATALLGAVSPGNCAGDCPGNCSSQPVREPHPAATEVTVSQERLPRAASSSAELGTLQPLLTDRDVAAVLAVRPDTVRRWAACGLLPSVRLGGRLLRFRAEDVQQ